MKLYQLKEVLAFGEAWLLLHFSKLLILFFPFRSIAARLGQSQFETSSQAIEKKYWLDVEVAINRASRFTLHKSKCYDQALTGKQMLKRRGVFSTLYFGLSKAEDGLSAHAWVRAGDRIVTGRAVVAQFTPVAWFGDQSLK
jgi:hypothetical protein